MRQVTFALQFKGKRTRWPGRYRGKTSASDQTWRTALSPGGVDASVEPAGSGTAACEIEIEAVVGHGVPDEGEGTFTITGSVKYGGAGRVTFKTVGQSVLAASAAPGLQQGAVIWEVTGGDGQFAGATGLITSNFSMTTEGELVDNQLAQLFLP
jgi:hypothetical protein